MAWNEPGNKDPWGRNKSNSNLDGVFKEFKKTIDDLLDQTIQYHHLLRKAQAFYPALYWQSIFYLEFIL